jgi:hypothetical protein
MHCKAASALFFGAVVLAQLSIVSVAAAQLPPFYNPANGHYYQPISTFRLKTFDEALTKASGMAHLGVPGHLATITSQAEQDFLNEKFASLGYKYLDRYWIGASDAVVEGEWRWVAGPESGQLFWLGDETGTAFGFQDWGRYLVEDEPNNWDGTHDVNGEDFAYVFFRGRDAQQQLRRPYWNDIANGDSNFPLYALVEFSPVPEPSTASLGCYPLLAIAFGRGLRLLPTRRGGG